MLAMQQDLPPTQAKCPQDVSVKRWAPIRQAKVMHTLQLQQLRRCHQQHQRSRAPDDAPPQRTALIRDVVIADNV